MRKFFTLLILVLACNAFFSQNAMAFSRFELSNYYDARENVSIYPNPIVNTATIKIANEVNLQESKVSIVFYNIVGKEIFRISQVKDYQISITKDNFKSSGVYFFQLMIDDKLQNTGKVVVK